MKKIKVDKYVILMAVMLVVLLIRSMYSFNQSDESFYMSLVHRMYRGDKLIVDEWHPTQFYTFILLPFYSLYRLIVPGGEGVILYFRIIACLFSFAVALYVYFTIKRLEAAEGFLGFAAAVTVMLYTKSNILGVSYNNACTLFFILSLILLSEKDKDFSIKGVLSGICAAMAVLCMPYLGAAVVAYALACLIMGRRPFDYMAGLIASAIVYIPVCFPLNNIEGIADSFMYIFADPEHSGGYFHFLKKAWWSFKNFNNRAVLYSFLAFCIILVIYYLLGKSIDAKCRAVLLLILLAGMLALSCIKGFRNPGYPAIAVTIYSLPIFIINGFRHKATRLCNYLLFGGLIVALAYAGGSDTRLNGTTTGFTITAVAAYIAIEAYIKDIKEEWHFSSLGLMKVIRPAAVTGILIILSFMLIQRIIIVVRDADLNKLTCRLNDGPGAYLYTTPEHAGEYEDLMEMIDRINADYDADNVFYSRILPWAYLVTDGKCGAPTAWRMELSQGLLEDYYGLHPDRIPDVVVVLNEDVGSFETCSFNRKKGNNNPNENKCEGMLWDYMLSQGYESIKEQRATVYYRPECRR